ncbi:hypothetical protein CVT24_007346 [Panaeolus cyanescens]|uniref:Uncharacterized protein n=1 Tax=Panaeolus cyanescens TaxID=181874 RepID=A0A409YW94_9AGAR|nr:hypothetical protein CVT24_007346 [Panaeolus cyanescens]
MPSRPSKNQIMPTYRRSLWQEKPSANSARWISTRISIAHNGSAKDVAKQHLDIGPAKARRRPFLDKHLALLLYLYQAPAKPATSPEDALATPHHIFATEPTTTLRHPLVAKYTITFPTMETYCPQWFCKGCGKAAPGHRTCKGKKAAIP